MDVAKEFEKQVNSLLEKGYPEDAGVTVEKFISMLEPLKKSLESFKMDDVDYVAGRLPFVIVVKGSFLTPEKMISKVLLNSKHGVSKLFPLTSEDFVAIDGVLIPEGQIYLLVDIDRGREYLNVRPQDALLKIKKLNRSPLTIDEGIAVITHYPDFLIKNNCFSLLGSRHPGDQRVPAIWIDASKNPHLGWCWDGNPHTWLGSASCVAREANIS